MLTESELAAAVVPPRGVAALDELLVRLNVPQRQVAMRGSGPLLVVAGPGAGKTGAIVARLGYLLLARRVPDDEVLALTFSRRAAGELQERIGALLGRQGFHDRRGGAGVWAGTFHALGARILRRGGAAHFGRPVDFTVYDGDDTERALHRHLATLGAPAALLGQLTSQARSAISLAKRRGCPPQGELEGDSWSVPLGVVAERYAAELTGAAAFDFDDLIGSSAAALERDDALLAWARRRARHLLVDEYQDTDPAQEALLQVLAPPDGEPDICVVADPQQSIYAFRGAAPEQVERFLARWPGAAVIRLEQNYRSTKSIVAVAQRLVARYAAPASGPAMGLRLWTENPPGEPARLWVAPNPEREAQAIAADVAARLVDGWAPEELAILVRTHAQARPIEAALLQHRVPHVLVGGVRFFAREEIKDALAYLRLAVSPRDAAAFWRIVNTPRRGLGPAAVLAIARQALAGGGPVEAARRWAASEAAPDGLYDLLAHLDELTAIERTGGGPAAVLQAALQLVGYRDYVVRRHPEGAPARLEALAELLRLARDAPDARQLLDDAALAGEADDPVPSSGRVRLSTVHAAKGLEFRGVYVPGCELGLFPLRGRDVAAVSGARRAAEPGSDAEERRVFYVAVTRARESLTLSYCTFRRDDRTEPSPYLGEIGRGLLRRAKLGTSQPPAPKRRAARRAGDRAEALQRAGGARA